LKFGANGRRALVRIFEKIGGGWGVGGVGNERVDFRLKVGWYMILIELVVFWWVLGLIGIYHCCGEGCDEGCRKIMIVDTLVKLDKLSLLEG